MRQKAEKRKNKAGQVTLEVAFAFACILVLLFGVIKIFLWLNERLVIRQIDYERTMNDTQEGGPAPLLNESDYPKLDIFGD